MPLDQKIADYFKTAEGKSKFAKAVAHGARELMKETVVRRILQVEKAPREALAIMGIDKNDYYVDVDHHICKIKRSTSNLHLPDFELSHSVSISFSALRRSDFDSSRLTDLDKTFAREISKLELDLFAPIIQDLYETSREMTVNNFNDIKDFDYIFCHSHEDLSYNIKLSNHVRFDNIQLGTVLAVKNLTGFLGEVTELTVLPSDDPGDMSDSISRGPSIGFTCFEQISMLVKTSNIECVKFVDESKCINKFSWMNEV